MASFPASHRRANLHKSRRETLKRKGNVLDEVAKRYPYESDATLERAAAHLVRTPYLQYGEIITSDPYFCDQHGRVYAPVTLDNPYMQPLIQRARGSNQVVLFFSLSKKKLTPCAVIENPTLDPHVEWKPPSKAKNPLPTFLYLLSQVRQRTAKSKVLSEEASKTQFVLRVDEVHTATPRATSGIIVASRIDAPLADLASKFT